MIGDAKDYIDAQVSNAVADPAARLSITVLSFAGRDGISYLRPHNHCTTLRFGKPLLGDFIHAAKTSVWPEFAASVGRNKRSAVPARDFRNCPKFWPHSEAFAL